ncbi:MAG: TIGR01777 family oxidoreductase [Leptospiraceae bacterium]|nr:TIGR01777 family oxidoreductase [Leptospiraceae bacterium]MDW7976234.1 TIGR01777 family oxidoreductase [Leptospiraceae bacterium]
MKKITITGGTGFIGRKLTEYFINKNHKVLYLSHSRNKKANVPIYFWDPSNQQISDEGKQELLSSDVVIHLSGANIAERRWDENYKKLIVESRVKSTKFLSEILNQNHQSQKPEVVIFASATGYYGNRTEEVDEYSPPGTGFLAETCVQWEQASINLHPHIRKAHIRIGFVMDKNEGGFPRMILPIKLFVGTVPGSGKQYVSWIHIDDLVRIFDFILENPQSSGVYNGTAPNPVTLEELMKKAAKYLNRPMIFPNIPDFALELILGEMSQIVLEGAKVIPSRIQKEGFVFQYPDIDSALKNLL